jgi:hypothetical protein
MNISNDKHLSLCQLGSLRINPSLPQAANGRFAARISALPLPGFGRDAASRLTNGTLQAGIHPGVARECPARYKRQVSML